MCVPEITEHRRFWPNSHHLTSGILVQQKTAVAEARRRRMAPVLPGKGMPKKSRWNPQMTISNRRFIFTFSKLPPLLGLSDALACHAWPLDMLNIKFTKQKQVLRDHVPLIWGDGITQNNPSYPSLFLHYPIETPPPKNSHLISPAGQGSQLTLHAERLDGYSVPYTPKNNQNIPKRSHIGSNRMLVFSRINLPTSKIEAWISRGGSNNGAKGT